jgi:gluconolactonase
MTMSRRPALALLLLAAVLPLRDVIAQSPVPEGAEVERIADGFQFVEGPVWYDGGLLFSDIPANRVYRWTEEGGIEVFREPSGHSNGLALDDEGRLLLAQHGPRRVARIEDDDSETVLAGEYDGMRLNSPNDLTVHSDGSVYFTDPTWGWQSNQSDGPPVLGFMGVFRIDLEGGVHLMVDSLFYPNGIVFSPDESTLYVSTSHQRTVVAYDVDDHTLSGGRVVASLQGNDAADGMKVDSEGLLYVTGPGGVWIFSPDGTLLDRIDVPGQTTNLAWGDADGGTLYITSGTGVYRIRLRGAATGMSPDPGAGSGHLLQPVYPNPSSESW